MLLASSGADGQLQLATTKKQVAAINSALVQNGIAVYSLEAKRKLEDYFIKIVNNGHVVSEHL